MLFPVVLSFQEPEVPIFRGGGLTVLVDAIITDKKNRVVTDLKPEDFILYEEDVEQQIDRIELYRANVRRDITSTTSTDILQPEIGLSDFSAQVVREQRNIIIIVLDYATTEYIHQNLVQEAAIKYVNENLQSNDFVAVFGLGASFGLLQDFTNNKELLIEALKVRDMRGQTLASMQPSGPPVEAIAGEVISDTTLEISGSSPQEIAASAQAAQQEGSELARLAISMRIQRAFHNMGSFVKEREARGVLTAIRAIAQGVESIEGRKTLILFSEGFVIGPHLEYVLERTVNLANRANLAVYSVDSQGLLNKNSNPGGELYSIGATQGYGNVMSGRRIDATGGHSLFDRAKEVGSDVRDSALRYVSVSTGGFAIRNTNDLHIGLERIDQDIRSYYLLSYRPQNQEFDGNFRNIRIEVRNPDYTVRHRTGYLAVPPGSEVLTPEEYKLFRAVEKAEISMGLDADFYLSSFIAEGNKHNVLVSLEIPGEAVEFKEIETENQPIFQTEIEVIGILRDVEGRALLRFGTPMTHNFTKEEVQVLKDGGLSFNNQLELTSGDYSIQMLIRDLNSGRNAISERSIHIPEDSSSLQLSTIVLSKEVQPSEQQSGFLIVENSAVLPSAGRKFRNGENLIYYFEVYNFELQGNLPDLTASIAIVRPGQVPIQLPGIELNRRFDDGKVRLSKFVQLSGLHPGTYFFETKVTDRLGGESVVGRTTFEVVK
jgi:VWFA-related protein